MASAEPWQHAATGERAFSLSGLFSIVPLFRATMPEAEFDGRGYNGFEISYVPTSEMENAMGYKYASGLILDERVDCTQKPP